MQTIYIDISSKGVVPTIYAKQGDIGRKFEVIFTNSGLPYTIPADSVFSVWYSGESGEGNYTNIGDNSAFYVNENKVTVELITQMLTNDGNGILCIVLNESNGNQIGYWNIPYLCEKVPGFESEGAKEYYTAFSKSVEGLKQITENLTPEAIGAHPDTWLPTIEEIGAAPAGYGYGGKITTKIYNINGTEADFNAMLENVFASMSDEAAMQVQFLDASTGDSFISTATLYKSYSDYGWLKGTDYGGRNLQKVKRGGTWQPWEWVNPPMVSGVEYRTTERVNGKAVYAKLVDCGYLPNASHSTVDWGVNGGARPIRWSGFVESDGEQDHRALPYDYMDNSIRIGVTNWVIFLTTSGDYSMQKAYVQVWYTK